MKLKSLYIGSYKNIQEQAYDFNNKLIALVGENGSGKSNLLEAISAIFNDILRIQPCNFDYLVEYEIRGYQMTIIKDDNNNDFKVNNKSIKLDQIEEKYLPSRIIANYSGEDLRLFNYFYKPSYDKFNRDLKSNRTIPNLPMIYINKYYWALCLLSLIYTDFGVHQDIADFCKSQLRIKSIKKVLFTLDLNVAKSWKENEPRQLLQAIYSIDELSNLTNGTISLAVDELKNRTDFLYGRDLDFFLYLYSAYTNKDNKLLTDISFEIEINDGVVIGVNELSEGEKKLILIEFITKVLSDENTLVLLDEPDAHVHISRKREILNIIDTFEGQTMLTTHSPIFVNEIYQISNDSLYFLKDGTIENGKLIKKLIDLSGGELDYINGSVVFASKNILALEGLSDIKSLRRAFYIFAKKDSKYKKLQDVQMVSFGGMGNADELFTQVLSYHVDHIEHLVYLFDNDNAGKSGKKKIEEMLEDPKYSLCKNKISSIFYKDGTANFELEDLFPKISYVDVIKNFRALDSYRDFKNNNKKVVDSIKERVKNDIDSFKEDWFNDFGIVLDKLLLEFGL